MRKNPNWVPCDEPTEEDKPTGGMPLHVPPECQGQFVEHAYGLGIDFLYHMTWNRSDGSITWECRPYTENEMNDAQPVEPWNHKPE